VLTRIILEHDMHVINRSVPQTASRSLHRPGPSLRELLPCASGSASPLVNDAHHQHVQNADICARLNACQQLASVQDKHPGRRPLRHTSSTLHALTLARGPPLVALHPSRQPLPSSQLLAHPALWAACSLLAGCPSCSCHCRQHSLQQHERLPGFFASLQGRQTAVAWLIDCWLLLQLQR
jgi:hypothetical protein